MRRNATRAERARAERKPTPTTKCRKKTRSYRRKKRNKSANAAPTFSSETDQIDRSAGTRRSRETAIKRRKTYPLQGSQVAYRRKTQKSLSGEKERERKNRNAPTLKKRERTRGRKGGDKLWTPGRPKATTHYQRESEKNKDDWDL